MELADTTEQTRADSSPQLGAVVSRRVMYGRLAAGLLQGLLLYGLYRAATDSAWPASQPYLFVPLMIIGVLLPPLFISAIGHIDTRRTAIWICVAAFIMVVLSVHDVWRGGASPQAWPLGAEGHARMPSGLLFFFGAGFFYIAQALALAAAADGRRIARYATYFELSWKLVIQLEFSVLFVGALWLVLWMGASLFMLLNLDFLKELLQRSWFVVPVTCFAFSCAMHITDVRPAIVRGIRTLLLVLMSWILPITALIVTGFLVTLIFTGLDHLWQTRFGTSLLLGTDVVLVVLINAAFQNGEAAADVAPLVRLSARVAALLLLPLTAIAIYALALRVGDYGWTSERVIAAACLLVAACYAAGYTWAVCQGGTWLAPVATVNMATAFVILAVLLALFTPLADPARLSVNDQMARLDSGKVAAAKFDFIYLKFEGARYGRAALEQLRTRTQGADAARIRKSAELALTQNSRLQNDIATMADIDVAANLTVWPSGTALPATFLQQDWREGTRRYQLPSCMTQRGRSCDAFVIDVNLDGEPEVLVMQAGELPVVLGRGSDGKWQLFGTLPFGAGSCAPLVRELKAGQFQLIAPRAQDLRIAGQRVTINTSDMSVDFCAGIKAALEPKSK